MDVKNLGLAHYGKAWQYQEELFNEALDCKKNGLPTRNTLVLCEHPHTLTIGKNGNEHNLLISEQMLQQRGVALYRIDRGGDITYHGPGQLVGYPIFDLESFAIGLKTYIHTLEEIVIALLAHYGISAARSSGAAGVWIDGDNPATARKICAIGVRSSRYVTMHGFALNVNTDLSYFSLINPCGFTDRGVTSMQKELGAEVDLNDVSLRIQSLFAEKFKTI